MPRPKKIEKSHLGEFSDGNPEIRLFKHELWGERRRRDTLKVSEAATQSWDKPAVVPAREKNWRGPREFFF